MVQDLLTPSLSESKTASLYSSGALLAAAFFGGTFAVTFLATANSVSLGRLKTDFVVLALLPVAAVLTVVMANRFFPGLESGDLRLLVRVLGFAGWILVYALHAKAYKAMRAMGLEPRDPWLVTVLSCIVGAGINAALIGAFDWGGGA